MDVVKVPENNAEIRVIFGTSTLFSKNKINSFPEKAMLTKNLNV